jgi:hypothetical protein
MSFARMQALCYTAAAAQRAHCVSFSLLAIHTGALLCGQKEMSEEVKALLSKSGVFEGRQLMNF